MIRIIPHSYGQGSTSSLHWKAFVNKLANFDKDVSNHWGIYSPAERLSAQLEREKEVSQNRKRVIKGMLEEHQSVANDVIRAEKLMRLAQKEEINSWNPEKLNQEMNLAGKRARQALKADDSINLLKGLVQEADQSKDRYKIRAITEVLIGEGKQLAEFKDRVDASWLNKLQGEKTIEIRTTEKMRKAKETADLAYDNYENKKKELCRASKLIGEGDPLHPLATNDLSREIKKFNNRE